MKISHWIADLITGGELSRAVREAAETQEVCAQTIHSMHQRSMQDDADHYNEIESIYADTKKIVDRQFVTDAPAWRALEAIKAMETPKANATVRRMAKIAKDATKPFEVRLWL